MIVAVKYIHLLTLVIWIGSVIFFSFVAAPSIFKNFDRKMAGDIVGTIFPKYFMLNGISGIAALLTLSWIGFVDGFAGNVKTGIYILLVMICVAGYSGIYNGPKARGIKAEIRQTEDPAKVEVLRKSFGKLHGISMALNIFNLILGLVLLFYALRYVGVS